MFHSLSFMVLYTVTKVEHVIYHNHDHYYGCQFLCEVHVGDRGREKVGVDDGVLSY